MVELERLKVRAKALEADVPVPTSHGLQICAMALGPSTQSQELRVPIAETSVHPSPPGLGSLVCTFPGSQVDSLEPTPSSLASGRCSDHGPLGLTLSPHFSSFICLPASPSFQQLLLRSRVSLVWIWPCGQVEEAAHPLPRLSLPGVPS